MRPRLMRALLYSSAYVTTLGVMSAAGLAAIDFFKTSPVIHPEYAVVPYAVQKSAGSDARQYCASFRGVAENPEIAREVIEIRDTLAAQKTGKFLIDTALRRDAWMCILPTASMPAKGRDASYEFHGHLVLLSRASADHKTKRLKDSAHELRHLWQDEQGLLRANATFSTYEEYESSRLYAESDATAVSHLVLWEADQADGGRRLQDSLAHSRVFEKDTPNSILASDITAQFIAATGESGAEGPVPATALRQAFRQWFSAPVRPEHYRSEALQACYSSLFGYCDVAKRPEMNGQIPVPGPSLRRTFSGFGALPHYGINYLTAHEGFDRLLMDKTSIPGSGRTRVAAP